MVNLFYVLGSILLGVLIWIPAQGTLPYPIQEPGYVDSSEAFKEAIPQEYHQEVSLIAEKYRFSYKLIYRLVHTESRWNRWALGRNRDGSEDRGLCQLNSRNNWPGDPWHPGDNLENGFRYLRHLVDRFGSLEAGLQAYNGGPGRFIQGKVPQASKAYAKKILAEFL